jgi:hypothetical protein
MFLYNIDSGYLNPNPQNFRAESYSIFTSPENRSRAFEQEAEKQNWGQKEGDQNINDE